MVPVVAGLPSTGRADAPLSYLSGYGLRAHPVTPLTWGMLIISLTVIATICILLIAALLHRRSQPSADQPPGSPLGPEAGGLSFMYVGVGVTTFVLFAVTVWTMFSLAALSKIPPQLARFSLEVVGHQWWWEVHYDDGDPSHAFTTANEIHIPSGPAVQVKLISADVIHSFWVPSLGGKMDIIPGQTNTTWLQADKPGIYRGQCGEYCGRQHAHMGLTIVVTSIDAFNAWWEQQLSTREAVPAELSIASEAVRDEQTFVNKCGACHAIRGSPAGGNAGPNLSHFLNRQTIAAGALPNSPGNLSAWIADPQYIKPGCLMPQLELSGLELTRVSRFLEGQK